MGAKTCMLVYSTGDARAALGRTPSLDRAATEKFARLLFPDEKLTALDDGTLLNTCPPDSEICIGCFDGVSIVAAEEFGLDRPSKLPQRFIQAGGDGMVTLHAMHSGVSWFAFAQWRGGKLVRSLSLAPDDGVIEDLGSRLAFEEPYWEGRHPAFDPDEEDSEYPFPFHPMDLGEAALSALFGYTIEGEQMPALCDPCAIQLMRFGRSRGRLRLV